MSKKRSSGHSDSDKPARAAGKATSTTAPAVTQKSEETPFVLTLRDVEVPPPPARPQRAGRQRAGAAPTSNCSPSPTSAIPTPIVPRSARRGARRCGETVSAKLPTTRPLHPRSWCSAPTTTSCGELCAPLRAFGFGVQRSPEPPALPAPWPFVAVFVTAPIHTADGGDAFDLCNQVRESSRLPGGTKPLLVLVTQQLSATDRVRAGLAGCHEILLGAPTRGSVAQLLDGRAIALPSDARRI